MRAPVSFSSASGLSLESAEGRASVQKCGSAGKRRVVVGGEREGQVDGRYAVVRHGTPQEKNRARHQAERRKTEKKCWQETRINEGLGSG